MRCVSKSFLLAAAFCSSLCAPALARDPAPPAFGWTGFYFGVNLGGARGDSDFTHTATGAFTAFPPSAPNLAVLGSGTLSPHGVIGGGQVGYNWQIGRFVVGVEADIQAWNFSTGSERAPQVYFSAVPTSATAAFSQAVNSDYLFTLRPRVGLVLDGALVYLTGGLAVTDLKFSQSVLFGPTVPSTASGSVSETRVGWTVGGGAEFVLTKNWTVKGEYLFVQFSDATAHLFNPTASTFTHVVKDDLSAHIVRFGINYKF